MPDDIPNIKPIKLEKISGNDHDGDYYKLQVSYDITDSAFLNSVVFKIPKHIFGISNIKGKIIVRNFTIIVFEIGRRTARSAS
jgi:hypothetical protein